MRRGGLPAPAPKMALPDAIVERKRWRTSVPVVGRGMFQARLVEGILRVVEVRLGWEVSRPVCKEHDM